MIVTTAICTIIKDEHRFLKEWIDWHLGLGFNAIHLFEDKGSKSHEAIVKDYSNVYLRRYEDDEEVQELLADQGNSCRQQTLYEYFSEKHIGVYDWVAYIDLDEFFFFKDGYTLDMLCKEFEPYSSVLLNWKMMGASGRITRPTCGVVEAYTIPEDPIPSDKYWTYKSFVNLNRYKGFYSLHEAQGAVNTSHVYDLRTLNYDKAWLNHYFTKSWEDWLDRIYHRGGTLVGHRRLCDFFDANPSMKYLEDLVVRSYVSHKPVGTCHLKNDGSIMCGGNVHEILRLNARVPSQEPMDDNERLERAIKEASKYGFKDNGHDKLVHVIWLGKKKFPEVIQKCMESWKKYLTDQTLCLWTEASVDFSHDWVRLAYDAKEYAFAADYLRLWVIQKYGGIYVDPDVELIKPINDLPKNFFAIERSFHSVAFGLMFGAEAGNEIIEELRSMYDHFFFEASDKEHYIQPSLTTDYLKSRGWEYKEGVHQYLGFIIFPPEYFSPIDYRTKEQMITENTKSIHHYTKLW